jgi:hypothetical protein
MPRMSRKITRSSRQTLATKTFILREIEADVRLKELEVEQKIVELESQKAELEQKLRMARGQERTLLVLIAVFTGLILFTVSLILLDGFNLWGFKLDTTTLNLLAGATIAEVAGLLGIAFRWLYQVGKLECDPESPRSE